MTLQRTFAKATMVYETATTISQLQQDIAKGGTRTITLGASMTSMPATGAGLTIPVAANITLNLNGNTLTTTTTDGSPGIKLGQASFLTLTDTHGGTVLSTANIASNFKGTSYPGAGIQTTGATLTINGDATVVAIGTSEANNWASEGAGIGGSGGGTPTSMAGGTVNIGGAATVNAVGPAPYGNYALLAAGIGGGTHICEDSGNPAVVTIAGNPSITTSGAQPVGSQIGSIGSGEDCDEKVRAGQVSLPAPSITSLSKTSVAANRPAQVKITGTGFIGTQFVTSVALGSTQLPPTSYAVSNGKTITVNLPAHAAGRMPITVSTAGGTSNQVNFTYVAPPAVHGTRPVVAGVLRSGSVLTARPGSWSAGTKTVTLRYQWFAAGRAISGATARTLRLTSAFVGKRIAVRVVGSAPGYRATSMTSAASQPVTR